MLVFDQLTSHIMGKFSIFYHHHTIINQHYLPITSSNHEVTKSYLEIPKIQIYEKIAHYELSDEW